MISIGGADHAIFQWRFVPEDIVDNLHTESVMIASQKLSGGQILSRSMGASIDQSASLPEPYHGKLLKTNRKKTTTKASNN